MGKVLIIGAGGVATVAAHKVAKNTDVFNEIMIASRTKSKCDAIVKAIGRDDIKTAQVDADSVEQLCALMNEFKPDLVMNLALPYQDLTIMEACLQCGCSYLDTANYEPKDEAHFEYSWQWAFKDRFEKAGLTAILGCGFDPGVTSIYTAYAAKHHFDEIQYLDIVDCNAGDHHKAFATNFNPEINIREITQKGLYWQDGKWVETEPLEIHKPLTYPEIGPKESYLLHHEEIESLVKNYPTIKRARFWMTFGQEYLTHLRVIQNIGMASIKGISAQHINSPLVHLGETNELKVDATYYLTGGCNIKLRSPFLTIKPSFLVRTDGVAYRGDITTRLVYTHEKKMMYVGAGYSPTNSVTVLVGGNVHGIVMGYSYEMYTSAINPGNGSHELFIGYQMDLNLQKKGKNLHKSVRIL